jgi:hypothetical protein
MSKGAKELKKMQSSFSFRMLEGLTGIPAGTLGRYARGVRTPDLAHAVLIEDTLRIGIREWLS